MPPKQTKPTSAMKQPAAHSTSLSPIWQQRLKELEAFKRTHGHCNVPAKYSPNRPLANWVFYIRGLKKSGQIASDLARRLDGLGFAWVLRRRAVGRRDWDTMVAALTAFEKEHGHCRVPVGPTKYRILGMWLINVRARKKKGLLDRGRIRQLDKLGVVWELQDQSWEDMFAELVAYRAKHGDCNVPSHWPENPKLAFWVQGQRQHGRLNTLTQDRLERLDKIGFVWSMRDEAWESMYAALVEYKRVHGHCRVPTEWEEDASLSRWVIMMRQYRRRGKLSEERIRRLTELGFVWDGALQARMEEVHEEIWESKYAALIEYKRVHGHCRVPAEWKEDVSLGYWVRTLRVYRKRGKLSEERIRRLDELGFVWDGRL